MTRPTPTLALTSRHVVTPEGVRHAAVLVHEGTIEAVVSPAAIPEGCEVHAFGDLCLMPGLVDAHVHVNEPGRTDWEGYASATRAAAAGGVTTIIDMPLNGIPALTHADAFAPRSEAIRGAACVDVGLWGGVVPGNLDQLEALTGLGVRGFKCFLCPSGVDEFEHVTGRDLEVAMPILGRLGLPLLAHAESPAHLLAPFEGADPRRYDSWAATRPQEAEVEAVRLLARLAGDFYVHVHVVHMASARAVQVVRTARARGVPMSAETCPHYLTFDAESVPDGATAFKCAPPLREARNRDRLWSALLSGDLDLVASDHSPAPASLKAQDSGNFLEAWGGIASLQLTLPALWTGARGRGAHVDRLSRWLSGAPAELAGLSRKGSISPGKDADLVAWDPDAEWEVHGEALLHHHPLTPYEGMRLSGLVERTYVRGVVAYDRQGAAAPSRGRLLVRGPRA